MTAHINIYIYILYLLNEQINSHMKNEINVRNIYYSESTDTFIFINNAVMVSMTLQIYSILLINSFQCCIYNLITR